MRPTPDSDQCGFFRLGLKADINLQVALNLCALTGYLIEYFPHSRYSVDLHFSKCPRRRIDLVFELTPWKYTEFINEWFDPSVGGGISSLEDIHVSCFRLSGQWLGPGPPCHRSPEKPWR